MARELESVTGENPHTVGTINWYKHEIRYLTKEANRRFYEYDQSDYMPPTLAKWKDRLLTYGGKSNPLMKKETFGLGFSGKRKNVLIRQYNELKHFYQTDTVTIAGQEYYSKKEYNAYQKFNSNNILSWDYEKWKRMVDTFGNVDSEILRGFGYEDHSNKEGSKTAVVVDNKKPEKVSNSSLVNAFSLAYDNNVDLLTLMNEVDKELHSEGADSKTAIDLLFKKIRQVANIKDDSDNKEEENKDD